MAQRQRNLVAHFAPFTLDVGHVLMSMKDASGLSVHFSYAGEAHRFCDVLVNPFCRMAPGNLYHLKMILKQTLSFYLPVRRDGIKAGFNGPIFLFHGRQPVRFTFSISRLALAWLLATLTACSLINVSSGIKTARRAHLLCDSVGKRKRPDSMLQHILS